MNKLKMSLLAGGLIVAGSVFTSSAQAQVIVRRPFIGPRVVARAAVAPVAVARATVATAVAPRTITTYRTVTPAPTVVATPTITTYRTVRPVVVAPVYRTVVRPGWIPGRPVRNAVRLALP